MSRELAARATRVQETAQQRRTRLLVASPETSPTQYDLAVLFGYAPESWDGMWKLPAGHPILPISRNWAIVAEVVTVPGSHVARRTRRGRQKLRYRLVRAVDAR